MARLSYRSRSESESRAERQTDAGETCVKSKFKASGYESARVTGVRPETGRSSPWQGEAQGNLGGGPLSMLRFKSLE